MTGIKWLLSFETGIEDIDNDHRELIDTIGNIREAVDDGDLKHCRKLFKIFFNQARGHFRREEAFLKSIDFPRVKSHAISHNHLLKLCRDTMRTVKGETDTDAIAPHLENITYYLLEDVIKADAEFKSYARTLNLR